MELALLRPLSVGVVEWAAPEPRSTVIVKASFSLGCDGELRLAAVQGPLHGDAPSPSSPDELAAASDFAPYKERVDVLLLGHARAEVPAVAMNAALSVLDTRRSFVARSSQPAREIPLTVTYLRSDASSSAVPVRVGPLSPRATARRASLGGMPVDDAGLPRGPFSYDFDFGFFNAAPQPQQLASLPSGSAIVLSGLLRGVPQRRVTIPSHRPLVYLADAKGGLPLSMRCDTVSIDTDREEVAMVWRGSFDKSAARADTVVLVSFEPAGVRWSAQEIRQRLAQAPRAWALEPGAVLPARAAQNAEDAARPSRRQRTVVLAAPETKRQPPLPRRGAPREPEVEDLLSATIPRPMSALAPFAPPDSSPPASSSPASSPPASSPPAKPASEPRPKVAMPIPVDLGDTVSAVHIGRPTLPFAKPIAPEAPAVQAPLPIRVPSPPALRHKSEAPGSPVPAAPSVKVPAPSAKAAPAPPVAAPKGAAADELLSVERFAAIRAELRTGTRRDVLQRHGFTPASWKRQEAMQMQAISAEAAEGRPARAAALTAALLAVGVAPHGQ